MNGVQIRDGLGPRVRQQTQSAAIDGSNVTENGSPLPAPWLEKDVGAIAPGNATQSAGAFIVNGAGRGLAGSADQFHYVYQAASGDIEITARLITLAGPSGGAKAGVSIRGGLGKSAAHATLLGTDLSGWEFRRRVTAGSKAYRTAGPAGTAPGWIRVVREGDLFTTYHSPDGAQWMVVGSDVVAMPDDVYIGLVVSSGGASTLAAATFDNVLVQKPSSANIPPQVSIVHPLGGETFATGVSIPVQASATDPDGVIAGVDFYIDNTKIGTDATSPFAAAWTAATAGSHMVSAVARDSDGASTVAFAVISVGGTTLPTTAKLRFVPSADHASNVSSYSVSVYHAADSVASAPVKKASLGKPSVIDGEITVDVSNLLGSLAAGTYKVVVTASNATGSTASQPSPLFAK